MVIRKLLSCSRLLEISTVFVLVAFISTRGLNDVLAQNKEETRFYLIGTGPGDPDLLTLRAIKAIEKSDLIICRQSWRESLAHYLKGKEVLDREEGLQIGYKEDPSKLKLKGKELLKFIEYAKKRAEMIAKVRKAVDEGKIVSVLDIGDPLIYGSCSWYLDEFEDLNPVVIPGLSSFNAANAALRKEITRSSKAGSIIVVCGNCHGADETIKKLAKYQATMVVFMNQSLEKLVDQCLTYYPPETPVAIVIYAGYKDKERIIKGTLKTILDQIKDVELPQQHLVYIGDFLRI